MTVPKSGTTLSIINDLLQTRAKTAFNKNNRLRAICKLNLGTIFLPQLPDKAIPFWIIAKKIEGRMDEVYAELVRRWNYSGSLLGEDMFVFSVDQSGSDPEVFAALFDELGATNDH